jgi:alpha-D-ribose 1-methylphosphonate 5-triphosphate synthase subunit PhnH
MMHANAAASLEGGFRDAPVDAARAFRSALTALSRPGRIEPVTGAQPPAPMSVAAGVLALTVADGDTRLWLGPSVDTEAVRDWLRFHTGAPFAARAEADFAFGTWEEMTPLSDFAIGAPEYPDRSATLLVEVPELGRAHRLTGPGIETEHFLTVPDPAALRANRALFPLGLDFFLTSGAHLAALPRTVQVEG